MDKHYSIKHAHIPLHTSGRPEPNSLDQLQQAVIKMTFSVLFIHNSLECMEIQVIPLKPSTNDLE